MRLWCQLPVAAAVVWVSALNIFACQGAPQESRYTLSVDVDLVSITTAATDESGKSIDDLNLEEFQLFEDGQEQKISFFSHESQVPISVGVLIDTSGSLQNKLKQAIQTVRAIAQRLSSSDEMFVITFNSHVDIRQKFTNVPDDILRALTNIHGHGETAVYDAISAGLNEMHSAKHQKRILILVSDGFDTASKIKADQAEHLIQESDVLLYVLGIDDGDQPVHHRPRYHIYEYMLNKLATAGGGRVIRLNTGQNYDLRLLPDMFLGELRQEYTMGYYPVARPGTPEARTVEIRVSRPGAHVLSGKVRVQLR